MGEQQNFSYDSESTGAGPFATHPALGALPREVRQQIADLLAQNKKVAAIKLILESVGVENIGLKEAKELAEGLKSAARQAQPSDQTWATGTINKGGTILTLYQDGTFTTKGPIFTSRRDRLIAFSYDSDSTRRQVYVKITGQRSGTKTYTSTNPDDSTLSSIRSLQAAAQTLLAAPSAVISASADVVAVPDDPSTPPVRDTDIATQLKILAELHAGGALSDDEFAAAKARILY